MQERKKWERLDNETEREIQGFWKKNRIYEKSKRKNAKGKPFYMMDGPPFPTGHIHLGTALNKSLKDASMRFKRMRGFDVMDIAGWDCHGLPTELKVEAKLGLKSREEIEEKIGVEKFVKECHAFSTEFIGKMTEEFENLGVWMDFENSYKTLDNEYIENNWWSFKQASDKGMLYKGIYPIQVCPKCETPLAFNEIEHQKLADTSVYVKFKLKEKENTFLIIWTTTPWTLPGNSGVMAHPEFEYVEAQLSNGEKWILAKELCQKIFGTIETGFTILRTFKGKELEGLRYEQPLEKFLKIDWSKHENAENKYKVILSARYVNLEDGTGLVHCAPGHGKEDFDAGKKAGLPALTPVQINGAMTQEAGNYAGKKAKIVDEEIIQDLQNEEALVFKHSYTHEYPICWRCNTPLLMISIPQWFFKTESLKEKAKEFNEQVNWVPKWAKERFKNWVDEGVADWPVTRDRFWGTPAPVWECKNCGEVKVIGSVEELKENAIGEVEWKSIDLHKPWIDKVELKCKKCGKEMKRIPEILDGWFDAGVSSWCALGFPKKKKAFEKYWPADLNIEGRDQIRGWWNSQLMCSMMAFGKKPFKTIGMHGFFLDLERKKMAKSKGNIVSPAELLEKNSRDTVRYYMVQLLTGEDLAFDWNAFKDINKAFSILQNSFNFLEIYSKPKVVEKITAKGLKAEDLWIVSRTNSLLEECIKAFENYDFGKATKAIDNFIIEDFSRTYIKLVRERIGGKEAKAVESTMNYCLLQLFKIMAPITPHLSEFYYQKMRSKGDEESIHLLELKNAEQKIVNKKLEEEMQKAKEAAEALLALRDENKLKLRWQLKEAALQTQSGKEFAKTKEILARMANVKKVTEQKNAPGFKKFASKELGTTIAVSPASDELAVFKDTATGKTKKLGTTFLAEQGVKEKKLGTTKVFLNLEADEELKQEWELSELLRRIQYSRKKAGLKPGQKASLLIECSDAGFVKKFKARIEKETSTKLAEQKLGTTKEKLVEREFSIELKA
ncbi:MAG: isoleucine--tRNA ligase [Candidatus Diapherotrites archaeon]|uniref:Isoleucine--tRNA ligase n=1 Tax=Candidatus Iainarchaeum sp. TaxID=3101447 RepID=A0A8T4KX47_9ARCH|nr:isoleucine--tRNA ligase [Candidatus Diapherotrites archaeon]